MKQLTPKQRAFVNELLKTPDDQRAAAIRAGVPEKQAKSVASQWMTQPKYAHVKAEYLALCEVATRASILTAEKVRNLVNGLLDLDPLEWFTPTAKPGVWTIGAEAFQALPREVKRYITGVQNRRIVTDSDEEVVVSVTLMDKDAALALAAKLTGVDGGGERRDGGVDWDALSKRRAGEHPVEARIREAGRPRAIEDKKQQGEAS